MTPRSSSSQAATLIRLGVTRPAAGRVAHASCQQIRGLKLSTSNLQATRNVNTKMPTPWMVQQVRGLSGRGSRFSGPPKRRPVQVAEREYDQVNHRRHSVFAGTNI